MDRFDVTLPDGAVLAGERHRGDGPLVVLLHAGVADRRAWRATADLLAEDGLDLVAFDRRGYGDSPAPPEAFTHLDDLQRVLDAVGSERAVVVGNSMGGALALDLALSAPDRVAALLLIGSAVSAMTDEGEPITWSPDPVTGAVLESLERAEQAEDDEERLRLELHLWLDGPTQPDGRVTGAARELAADMDRRVIAARVPEGSGDAGLDTWHRLGEIGVPVLATWGSLDLPPDLPFYELTAQRLGDAERRVLDGVAHLPSLEAPGLVADLVRETVRRAVAAGRL